MKIIYYANFGDFKNRSNLEALKRAGANVLEISSERVATDILKEEIRFKPDVVLFSTSNKYVTFVELTQVSKKIKALKVAHGADPMEDWETDDWRWHFLPIQFFQKLRLKIPFIRLQRLLNRLIIFDVGLNRLDWFIPFARELDILFLTDGSFHASRYGIKHFYDLKQSCDPKLHFPVPFDQRYASDIAFIGSIYTTGRRELIQKVRQTYDFKMYGFGRDLDGRPLKQVFGEEFSKVCNSAKIILGDNAINNRPDYWSNKVYLTLGCGGFFLTPYAPGLEKYFNNKEHLVWYQTTDEALDLIEYYLSHSEERKLIADNGYKLVHKYHTSDNRMKELLEKIKLYLPHD